ncbi:peptidyl-prolyl cis-trans isomerase [Striga asiatica]|uniref:peptidylprolyl isomerase n=1 Tax=Striga asiatica TaxID=4170 RepID=A0A5A7PG52_STRAF|nr:peptidyl-prolyl cis-trans isomerase [Striga asiatica]
MGNQCDPSAQEYGGGEECRLAERCASGEWRHRCKRGSQWVGSPHGRCAISGSGSTEVKIYYMAMAKDIGSVFESNVGKDALYFRLGDKEFIDGWNVGIDGMRIGRKRRLIVPPSIGFGDSALGEDVPPNSWLIYEIDLLSLSKLNPKLIYMRLVILVLLFQFDGCLLLGIQWLEDYICNEPENLVMINTDILYFLLDTSRPRQRTTHTRAQPLAVKHRDARGTQLQAASNQATPYASRPRDLKTTSKQPQATLMPHASSPTRPTHNDCATCESRVCGQELQERAKSVCRRCLRATSNKRVWETPVGDGKQACAGDACGKQTAGVCGRCSDVVQIQKDKKQDYISHEGLECKRAAFGNLQVKRRPDRKKSGLGQWRGRLAWIGGMLGDVRDWRIVVRGRARKFVDRGLAWRTQLGEASGWGVRWSRGSAPAKE